MVDRNLLLIAVYVDDLFVTGTNIRIIVEFKKEMVTNFEMSDPWKLMYYLGIKVNQHGIGITLN